jgi:hypothetical protein
VAGRWGERKEINENASNSGRVMDISQRFSSSFPLHIILSSFFLFRAMSRWKIKKTKNQWRERQQHHRVSLLREKVVSYV